MTRIRFTRSARTILLAGACTAFAVLAGCSGIPVREPVAMGDGVYLTSAYGTDLSEVKAALFETAAEFCDDDDLILHVESLTVDAAPAAEIEDPEDAENEGLKRAGSAELRFSCRKP